MCLIVFALNQHPRYPVILVGNRDEYYARTSTPMHWWPEPKLLAGRDEQAGGTWLGLTETGKWSAVTNFRGPVQNPSPSQSRGELVVNSLLSKNPVDEIARQISSKADRYSGFNLLIGDGNDVVWLSNRSNTEPTQPAKLESGIFGLSNHLLDTPWPKVQKAKQGLAEIIAADELDPVRLLDVLANDSRPPDQLLPDTGVGIDKERVFSSMFIADSNMQYGTRCTTAMLISADNRIQVAERTHPELTVANFDFRRYS